MPQVLDFLLEQMALEGLERHTNLLQQEQNLAEVLYVVVHSPGEGNHVVRLHQARLQPHAGQNIL